MATIRLQRRHQLGARRAREIAADIADGLARDYDMTHQWQNSVLQFRRPGIRGELAVTDDSLELRMDLGLAMRPFRERIESAVASRLDRLLAGAGDRT